MSKKLHAQETHETSIQRVVGVSDTQPKKQTETHSLLIRVEREQNVAVLLFSCFFLFCFFVFTDCRKHLKYDRHCVHVRAVLRALRLVVPPMCV